MQHSVSVSVFQATIGSPPADHGVRVSDDTEPTPVLLDHPMHLTAADVARIAEGAPVRLGDGARSNLAAARAVVERHLRLDAPVYGLNTMLGHMKNHRVSAEDLLAYQRGIIVGHEGGFGPPLPTAIARAAMAARLCGLMQGGAGATPDTARILVEMLNAGVHPLLPEAGSVGAGDLMHMAAIACVAIGQGRAEYRGEILPGADALARAGLAPYSPEPKDGVALVAANGVSIGAGALAVERVARLAELADLALALSLERIDGNLSVIDPAVGRAKPIPGQIAAIDNLRRLLRDSRLQDPAQSAVIQDPLSFRVGPQVHGALRQAVSIARDAVETELNARADNPVIDGERMVHNGNFQPMMLVLAFDMLRTAMTHVAKLSERRMGHVAREGAHDPQSERLSEAVPIRFRRFGFSFGYAAASRIGEMRALSGPSSLDMPSLDFDIEDHATNAPTGVFQTLQVAGWLEDVLAAELLITWRAIGMSGPRTMGRGTALAYARIDRLVEESPPEGHAGSIHERLKAAMPGLLRELAEGGAGP